MARTKKRVQVETEQVVYVSISGDWGGRVEPNLEKYIVTKANKSSFYAQCEDGSGCEKRFDQRTRIYNDGMGYRYIAYLTEEEYWNMIERRKEKAELKERLKKTLEQMSLEQLRELTKYLGGDGQ